ncbi:cytochrome oxidase small assembly protein [Massilia sp. TS11]|nr:cytochrome oxidase small assembly protein [Massilia sp. TS11]MCG2585362.1 cytochrome oxidase small assembly protein [Massilia sp. TS11]
MSDGKKPSNARLGLILGGVALVFFVAVIVRHLLK